MDLFTENPAITTQSKREQLHALWRASRTQSLAALVKENLPPQVERENLKDLQREFDRKMVAISLFI